jgi:hypothetical protein
MLALLASSHRQPVVTRRWFASYFPRINGG